MIEDLKASQGRLSLVFLYSGDFGVRVIRNLINDPSFCKSCGLLCDYCKYGVYSYVTSIRAAIELPEANKLPVFIEKPEKYFPKKIPKADLSVVTGIHRDLLLAMPSRLAGEGIKAIIVPIEDFREVPAGLKRQVEEECDKMGLEYAFPKPFCSLELNKDKPLISRFVREFKIGRPKLEISTSTKEGKETISGVIVRRSAPCGSTWYVARKLLGVEVKSELINDVTTKAHHSYPCTATMSTDPELEEPILHEAGYIIREEVNEALHRKTIEGDR